MPINAAARAAFFAFGATLGAGLTFALVKSRREQVLASPAPSGASTSKAPLLQIAGDKIADKLGAFIGSADEMLRYGNPGPVNDLLERKAYVASYDRRLRHPAWTAEHLTRANLVGGGGDRGNSEFIEDESLPALFRAKLKDYFRSGYDRGHMAPAADAKRSQEAMDETFILSNIAPQVGVGFNRHYWSYVEDWCRRLTNNFTDVYVFTVALYLPKQDPDGKWRVTHEVIGSPPSVAVPTHFAKVVLTTRPSSPSTPDIPEISAGAFVFPNASIEDKMPLQAFNTPIEAVERAAGLTLFSDEIKRKAKHICQSTSCDLLVRRFDESRSLPKQVGRPR